MKRTAGLLIAIASMLAGTAAPSYAQPLTVAVDDRTLAVPTIVAHDRVMVPMRPIFEALHASVRFAARPARIVARTPLHTVDLPIGTRYAFVDGRRIRLDAPARIVASRTFVPLRFVARALGAHVAYDANERLVNILSGTTFARDASSVSVSGLLPQADARLNGGFPTISARVDSPARLQDIHLRIDDLDVTPLSTFDGTTITFMPRTALSPGSHTVAFAGQTIDGRAFSRDWSFYTELSPPPGYSTWNGSYAFYVSGPSVFYSGDWMHFVLVAPPGGSAVLQLCDLGFQYPFWPSSNAMQYVASVPVPRNFWVPSCWANAIYRTWNGRQFVVPIGAPIAIYTRPTPLPLMTPPPRALIPGPRRPEPVLPTPPLRRPEASPPPKATASPKPIATARPEPQPPHRRIPDEPGRILPRPLPSPT